MTRPSRSTLLPTPFLRLFAIIALCVWRPLIFLAPILIASYACGSASASPNAAAASPQKLVIGVDGGTESIRACCFDAKTGCVVGKSCAVPYVTHHPQPGWAEQEPADWYANLGQAVRGALLSLEHADGEFEVCGLCVDTTCCSVVALDREMEPLRRCLLWMDARSAQQTKEILETCCGDPALDINCGGEGPLSAEWMIPKALWIRQTEPEVWEKATTICEYQDYINYKLTGKMVASSCNAATRWHWNGKECIEQPLQNINKNNNNKNDDDDDDDDDGNIVDNQTHPGRPLSLYAKLGIPELANKLPQSCLAMGDLVGHLTDVAAKHLGLPVGTPVTQGGPDAFVGMIGLGCIHPGQLCLITGSSHLHCMVSSKPTTAAGTWGAYQGAPLPSLNFAEGGQSSTGSILKWCKTKIFNDDVDYKELDEEASKIPPGSDGVMALETFQGSRTPITDPSARGALLGLSLSHTRAHIWRAWMEAVCFGTRGCIQDGLEKAGHACSEIIMAGGATRSPLWLQMHADVTGKPVVVCENADAPLLGCAILASVGAGIHDSVDAAVEAMVRRVERVEPDPNHARQYTDLYENAYKQISPTIQPIVHNLSKLRGGASGSGVVSNEDGSAVCATESKQTKRTKHLTISPSLLACDWARMGEEVDRCLRAGASRLHVDILDGVFVDSPDAFTFGPQMVRAIRRASDAKHAQNDVNGEQERLHLDLHMYVERPARFIDAMADAGADTFIFQWEAIPVSIDASGDGMSGGSSLSKHEQKQRNEERTQEAIGMAKRIIDKGMACGICINPSTSLDDIHPVLQSGLISVVDILAVNPGFGGQQFQTTTVDRLRDLCGFRRQHRAACGDFAIMVDGGINASTIQHVAEYADIAVAGTYVFRHKVSLEAGIKDLLNGAAMGWEGTSI